MPKRNVAFFNPHVPSQDRKTWGVANIASRKKVEEPLIFCHRVTMQARSGEL